MSGRAASYWVSGLVLLGLEADAFAVGHYPVSHS